MKESLIQEMANQLSCIGERLSNDALNELIHFVKSSQNNDGGFKNRDGSSDPYYSLFGFLIAYGLGLTAELDRLKEFLLHRKKTLIHTLTDEYALIIMDALLSQRKEKRWARKRKRISRKSSASSSALISPLLSRLKCAGSSQPHRL